jgi:4-alpha-glucanotransferase
MDVRCGNENEARSTLQEIERVELLDVLPPVMVVRAGTGSVIVPVSLPAGTGTISWSVYLEDGARHRGDVRFGNLPLTESASDNALIERRSLVIAAPDAIGYHRLQIGGNNITPAEMTLIIVPKRCHLPAGLTADRPLWGISLQLYLLRSKENWGIGDFGDLKKFVKVAARLGASVVGLNPLHAMFLDAPEQASPYSPASRLFLNILCIDITAIPEFARAEAARSLVDASSFQAALASCRAAATLEYSAVAALKIPVLERVFDEFIRGANAERRASFDRFRSEQGQALERYCRYQALREHFAKSSGRADWREWPEEFRNAESPAVIGFAEKNEHRIAFLAWAQWIADQQVADAAHAASAGGMTIGLYRDLAVGADAGGAETWANGDIVLSKLHVGAPPDILNPVGQDWGLPPFDPHRLRQAAYESFVALVRANMRHAGGLRIDHVMALQRLYLIPEGRRASEGAYVSYPVDDLVGILALESVRHQCLVVGEDLGTVPEGFRERMEAANILSYRIVSFEADHTGALVAPQDYPPLALATLGSHDLATLHGWWEGRDIALKAQHNLYSEESEETRQHDQRSRERAALVAALKEAGMDAAGRLDPAGPFSPELTDAVHGFLALTRSGLAILQLDDLTGETDQVNLPGTSDEHPNWRRKQSLMLEDIETDPGVLKAAKILNSKRPHAVGLEPHAEQREAGNLCGRT